MQRTSLSRTFALSLGLLALLTVAGCFQPAGSGFEQPIVAGPTFTPFPTEVVILPTSTPEVPLVPQEAETLPPSETPAELALLPSETPTPFAIAQLPTASPTLFLIAELPTNTPAFTATPTPFDNSAAINALLTPQTSPVFDASQATPMFEVAQAELNPFEITATFIVGQATAQAALPITQTAAALFGQPVATTPAPGVLVTPVPGLATPTPAPVLSGADCIHEVQATDRNLYRISLTYGTTVEAIARASGIANINLIYVGQQLTIPGCGTTGVRPPATSTPAGGIGTTTTTTTASTGAVSAGGITHIVAQGESLFELSLQYGVPVAQIAAANGVTDINLIYIGQELVIP